MLIIGAGGLVLQMIDDLIDQFGDQLVFWTDQPLPSDYVKEEYKLISDDEAVINYFKQGTREFIIAVGNPENRARLCEKFEGLGGTARSFISAKASISRFAKINSAAIVLQGSIVEAGVILEKGVLINVHSTITHEARIGAFSEIGPGVTLAGKVITGKSCFIGTGATIIPRIILGNNVVVGAGSLVISNVPDHQTVVGVPAKPIAK